MPQTVRVKLSRPTDAAGILVDMTARGLDGELESMDSETSIVLALQNGDSDGFERRVWLALEDSIAERGLPFVPMAENERSFSLRPALV